MAEILTKVGIMQTFELTDFELGGPDLYRENIAGTAHKNYVKKGFKSLMLFAVELFILICNLFSGDGRHDSCGCVVKYRQKK